MILLLDKILHYFFSRSILARANIINGAGDLIWSKDFLYAKIAFSIYRFLRKFVLVTQERKDRLDNHLITNGHLI